MIERIKIYPESHGRAPLIALDYDQRQLAQPKELMIDYSNQDLYLVDKNDSTTFYNLTSILTTKVSSNIDGDKIYVTVSGSSIKLSTYLERMEKENIKIAALDHSANVLNTKFDTKSIEVLDGDVQIAGFDTATNAQTPVKVGDHIEWTYSGSSSAAAVLDVKVDGTSVVDNNLVANIDLTGKQDTLPLATEPFRVLVSSDTSGGVQWAKWQDAVTVDNALSKTSENPVQNKVITNNFDNYVLTSRTINGRALTSNITLTASDVGVSVSASGSSVNKVKYITLSGTEYLIGVEVDSAISSTSTNPVQNKVIKAEFDNYLPLSGGTLSSVNSKITLQYGGCIVQNQQATSNYTVGIKWLKGGTSQATYDPHIGHMNTGGMVLVPYATSSNPWSGGVGLYIGQGKLTLDGNVILRSDNYTTYAVPTTRTINSKALSSNITLSASDIGISVLSSSSTTNQAKYLKIDGSEYKLGSAVSVSSTGSSTNKVKYITIDGTQSKLSSVEIPTSSSSTTKAKYIKVDDTDYQFGWVAEQVSSLSALSSKDPGLYKWTGSIGGHNTTWSILKLGLSYMAFSSTDACMIYSSLDLSNWYHPYGSWK